MGLESPASLGWALLSVVLACLYLWPWRRRREEVATLVLWQRALARRPAWLAARFWLSLATGMLILGLLVLALAQPFFTRQAAARRSVVLVLDVSASMSARDLPPSRFEELRSRTLALIDGLRRGERMGLITAGTCVRPVCRLGASRQTLRTACAGLAPTDGQSRVADAVAAARWMLRGQPNPQIIVISDGGFPEAAGLRQAADVRLLVLAGEPRNAGLTTLAVRPLESDPKRVAVLVEVLNGGAAPVDGVLEIGLVGSPSETFELRLEPGAAIRRELFVDGSPDAILRAALRGTDDLTSDDQGQLPIAGRSPGRVRLIAEPSEVAAAIQTTLQSVPGIELDITDAWQPKASPAALHVFYRQVPAELPPGPALVLDPQSSSDLWQITGSRTEPLFVQPTGRHPQLLSEVRLSEVVFERMPLLEFQVPGEPVATAGGANGGDVYSLLQRPSGPVLVFSPSLERAHSDFVLRPDFGQLIRNAVDGLLPASAAQDTAITTGEILRLEPGQTAVFTETPPDAPGTRQASSPLAVLDRVGVWDLRGAEEPPAPERFHVNLLNAAETTLIPPANEPQELPTGLAGWDLPLWIWLAGAGLLLLILDGCLFHRGVVV